MQPTLNLKDQTIKFDELEERFGHDNARDILRTLERMQGICEELVSAWSYEDRLENVFHAMAHSKISETRH